MEWRRGKGCAPRWEVAVSTGSRPCDQIKGGVLPAEGPALLSLPEGPGLWLSGDRRAHDVGQHLSHHRLSSGGAPGRALVGSPAGQDKPWS